MKKRENHKDHKREALLEREVSTPSGHYRLNLVPATQSSFSNSYDLHATSLNQHGPSHIERFLYRDACHDFEAKDEKHGKLFFSNTIPYDVGYDRTHAGFSVSFFQDIQTETEIILLKYDRSRTFTIPTPAPIQESSPKNLMNYLKTFYAHFRKRS